MKKTDKELIAEAYESMVTEARGPKNTSTLTNDSTLYMAYDAFIGRGEADCYTAEWAPKPFSAYSIEEAGEKARDMYIDYAKADGASQAYIDNWVDPVKILTAPNPGWKNHRIATFYTGEESAVYVVPHDAGRPSPEDIMEWDDIVQGF